MSNILIEASNISKIYGMDYLLKRGNNFYALCQVDFVLEEGDFVSVMGPSGSGKSTLLNCLSSLDTVSKGTVKLFGKNITSLSDEELSEFRYTKLGFIFQNHNLISTLSIFDNIATPAMLGEKNAEEIGNRVVELAKQLNIEHLLSKKPSECSGGEKQRAAIARALINNPKILICDEPTGNLDSQNSHEVLSILSDLNRREGTSIILVTHDNMIASYAKTFMYLRDGAIKSVLKRNDADQVEFFNEIVKITTKDSLLKIFSGDTPSPDGTSKVVDTTSKESAINRQDFKSSALLQRQTVYAIFPSDEPVSDEAEHYRNVNINEKTIEFKNISNEYIVIEMNKITSIAISLCARFRSFGLFSEYMYYVDLNISINDVTHKLELKNRNDLTPLFTLFNNQHIPLEDPIEIQRIYKEHPDYLDRHRYLQRRYKEMAKKFNLDFPRT